MTPHAGSFRFETFFSTFFWCTILIGYFSLTNMRTNKNSHTYAYHIQICLSHTHMHITYIFAYHTNTHITWANENSHTHAYISHTQIKIHTTHSFHTQKYKTDVGNTPKPRAPTAIWFSENVPPLPSSQHMEMCGR